MNQPLVEYLMHAMCLLYLGGRSVDVFVYIQQYMYINSFLQFRALSVIQAKGPIPKDNPNEVRKKPSPKSLAEIKRKVTEDLKQGEYY